MSRHAFVLTAASFALVSVIAACGGAVESPLTQSTDPNAPGSSGGPGNPNNGGPIVVGTCTAAPLCDKGDTQVESEAACPQDSANCYNRTFCGTTIWCAHYVCEGEAACAPGSFPVPSCKGYPDCYAQTVCGQTYYCAKDEVQCDGYPSCDPGDTQVASSSQCLQDDAKCYQRYACGYSIWCTGPTAQDGGIVPPPSFPPPKP